MVPQSALQGSPRVAGGGGSAAACDPNPPRPFARSRPAESAPKSACRVILGTWVGVPQRLVKGKYRCRKVRVYPAECGEQLGRDPSKNGSSKSLVFKESVGLVPSSHPHSLGYACTLCAPHFPSPKENAPSQVPKTTRKALFGAVSGPGHWALL